MTAVLQDSSDDSDSLSWRSDNSELTPISDNVSTDGNEDSNHSDNAADNHTEFTLDPNLDVNLTEIANTTALLRESLQNMASRATAAAHSGSDDDEEEEEEEEGQGEEDRAAAPARPASPYPPSSSDDVSDESDQQEADEDSVTVIQDSVPTTEEGRDAGQEGLEAETLCPPSSPFISGEESDCSSASNPDDASDSDGSSDGSGSRQSSPGHFGSSNSDSEDQALSITSGDNDESCSEAGESINFSNDDPLSPVAVSDDADTSSSSYGHSRSGTESENSDSQDNHYSSESEQDSSDSEESSSGTTLYQLNLAWRPQDSSPESSTNDSNRNYQKFKTRSRQYRFSAASTSSDSESTSGSERNSNHDDELSSSGNSIRWRSPTGDGEKSESDHEEDSDGDGNTDCGEQSSECSDSSDSENSNSEQEERSQKTDTGYTQGRSAKGIAPSPKVKISHKAQIGSHHKNHLLFESGETLVDEGQGSFTTQQVACGTGKEVSDSGGGPSVQDRAFVERDDSYLDLCEEVLLLSPDANNSGSDRGHKRKATGDSAKSPEGPKRLCARDRPRGLHDGQGFVEEASSTSRKRRQEDCKDEPRLCSSVKRPKLQLDTPHSAAAQTQAGNTEHVSGQIRSYLCNTLLKYDFKDDLYRNQYYVSFLSFSYPFIFNFM